MFESLSIGIICPPIGAEELHSSHLKVFLFFFAYKFSSLNLLNNSDKMNLWPSKLFPNDKLKCLAIITLSNNFIYKSNVKLTF